MTPTADIYGQRYLPPLARFSTSPQNGPAPLTVTFTERSTFPTTDSRAWDFGDGEMSTAENPAHEYLTPGSYTVIFTATWASRTYTATHLINVANPVQAQFTATPLRGAAPLTVTFSDQSQTSYETITEWWWDFGDGATSDEQQPSHVYETPGVYRVTLIASTDTYSTTVSKANYIRVNVPGYTTIQYTYDGLYRLTHAFYSTGQRFQYAYDPVGNRTTQTSTITSTQVANYAYDEANRLTAIHDNWYQTTSTFVYNGEGVRLQQHVNDQVVTYTQDLAAPLPVVLQSQAESGEQQRSAVRR